MLELQAVQQQSRKLPAFSEHTLYQFSVSMQYFREIEIRSREDRPCNLCLCPVQDGSLLMSLISKLSRNRDRSSFLESAKCFPFIKKFCLLSILLSPFQLYLWASLSFFIVFICFADTFPSCRLTKLYIFILLSKKISPTSQQNEKSLGRILFALVQDNVRQERISQLLSMTLF